MENEQELRDLYSALISNIDGMNEAKERFMFDGTLPPQSVIKERNRLKDEFKQQLELLQNKSTI